MTDHPTTSRGEPAGRGGIGWGGPPSVHRADDGGGVLHRMKEIHRGTLAQMVAMMRNMPEPQRRNFVIQKSGDHRIGPDGIMGLAERPHFPG